MTHRTSDITIKNRKVNFEYELIERFVAGIKLAGTEIKSIRGGKVNLTESYCQFNGGELFVKNMHISEYDFGTCNNHEARRDRKLLLNRKELTKLEKKVKEAGLTIVCVKLFVNERGLAKLEIALARGKKTYDKRETLKQKDSQRDMDRAMRN
jgi:SsrA-binding protein